MSAESNTPSVSRSLVISYPWCFSNASVHVTSEFPGRGALLYTSYGYVPPALKGMVLELF